MLKANFSAPTGRQVFLFLFSFLFICQLLFLPSIPLPSFRKAHTFSRELVQSSCRHWCWLWQGWAPNPIHPLDNSRNQDQPSLSSQAHEQERVRKKREAMWSSQFPRVLQESCCLGSSEAFQILYFLVFDYQSVPSLKVLYIH